MAVKYSVIVPAFKAVSTIDACLTALMSQSVPRDSYEVIVVDDGSPDATAEIASRYDIKLIRQPNRGPASARNAGAREASGAIILFTDSDCEPTYEWIERMVAPLESDPAVSGVKGAYRTRQRTLTARFAQVEFMERFEMLACAECIDMVDTYSAAFRRSAFEAMGGFDESFPAANNEDTDLSYRLVEAGHKLVFAPDAIVYHMGHPATPARYAKIKFWRGYWRMVVYRRFPGKAMRDTYTPKALKLQAISAAGLPFMLIGGLLWHPLWYVAVALAGVLLITGVPLIMLSLRLDPLVAPLVPLYVGLRGISVGFGAFLCLLRGGDGDASRKKTPAR